MRRLLRFSYIAAFSLGLLMIAGPQASLQNASTGPDADMTERGTDWKALSLIIAGFIGWALDYRLKHREDQRAARAEKREIHEHRRRMDDKH